MESDSELWGWPRGTCATGNFCPLPQSAEAEEPEDSDFMDSKIVNWNRGYLLSDRTVKSRRRGHRRIQNELRKTLFANRIRKLFETLQRAGDTYDKVDEFENALSDFGRWRGSVFRKNWPRYRALFEDLEDDELEGLSLDFGRGFVDNGRQSNRGYALYDDDDQEEEEEEQLSHWNRGYMKNLA